MASCEMVGGIPNIILIGVPSRRHLEKVRDKLVQNDIYHYVWHEPDSDMGFTAIATVPLEGSQKLVLSKYRLWRPLFGGSSEKEQHAASAA